MSEKITLMNIADAAEEYSKKFGANKNLYRTIPSFQDGMRPGKRRLFWAWWLSENKIKDAKNAKFRKVDTIASKAMEYHPHSDVANKDIIYKEGQYWNNNVMTIVPQGNFGSIRGDTPAAGRYTEAKLSDYTIDCFFADFDKYCVPMKPSYNGEGVEPEYFPSKYPNVMFNPQLAGIGYGIASNIPPFNVSEVLKATIALIKDPDSKIKLVPDSPTGADIIDEGDGFKEINKHGRGTFTLQATADIDYMKNIITVTSLPLQITSKQVIAKIVEMIKSKQFDDIIDISDYTKNGEVDLRITLKQDTNPDKILQKLYKKTDMRKTYPVDFIVIDDYTDHKYGFKEFLLEWIEYRRDIVRSMFNHSLQQTLEKKHLNDVLLMIFNEDNAEKTLNICKKSASRKDTINNLVKHYKTMTTLQAGTICDMRMSAFNKDSYQKYKDDKIKLEADIKQISEALEDDTKIDDFIINQLKEGIRKYGHPRKSKIIKAGKDVEETFHMIGVSDDGYIKKLPDNSPSIGPVGKGLRHRNIILIPSVSNKDKLLIVGSNGNIVPIKVSDIPELEYNDIGIYITKFMSQKYVTNDDIFVCSLMILPPKSDILDKTFSLVMVTAHGYTKKVLLSELKKLKNPTSLITLNKDDVLIDAAFCIDDSVKDIVICTNFANGIRLRLSDIPTSLRSAKGKRQLTFKDGEEVVAIRKIDPKKKYLFMITSAGRVKLTEMKYFPVMNKKDETLPLMTLTGAHESLIGVSSVGKNDSVEVYKKKSESESLSLNDVDVKSRIAKGDKKIKLGRGDSVVGYTIIRK